MTAQYIVPLAVLDSPAGQDGEADEAGNGVRQPGERAIPGVPPAFPEHVPAFAQEHELRSVLQGPDVPERDGAGWRHA